MRQLRPVCSEIRSVDAAQPAIYILDEVLDELPAEQQRVFASIFRENYSQAIGIAAIGWIGNMESANIARFLCLHHRVS